jgi:hypothetical protein
MTIPGRCLRLVFPTAFAAIILAACGTADQANLPTSGASAAVATATATPAPTIVPTGAPALAPTPQPVAVAPKATVRPTQKPAPPPPAPPAFNYCGAPANPWHYNFCGGNLVYNPPNPTFCNYFVCIASFWTEDIPNDGYVMQCVDGTYSLSGGESGSCSHHGGNSRALNAP